MTTNRENFKRFLNKEDIHFEDISYDDGGHGYRLFQSLDNGPRLILVVSFNAKDSLVDCTIYNIATIDNPLKKEFLHSLLNELNNNYRFTKFTEYENEVTAAYSMELVGNIDYSEIIFDMLLLLFNTVKDAFPKFMKLQWS